MMSDYLHNTTIAVLYPGEMGSAFGKLLRSGGFHVITTAEGRSSRTQRRCLDAGLSVFDSLEEVLQLSDVVLSLVSPNAALPLANEVAMQVTGRTRRLIYLDVNSISPMTVAQISTLFADTPVDFLDAALFGLATQLQHRGTIYISGPSAQELVQMFMPLLLAKNVRLARAGLGSQDDRLRDIKRALRVVHRDVIICSSNEPSRRVTGCMRGILSEHHGSHSTYVTDLSATCCEALRGAPTSGGDDAYERCVHTNHKCGPGSDFRSSRSQWPNNHDLQQWSIAEVVACLHAQGTLALPEARVEQIPMNQTAGSSK